MSKLTLIPIKPFDCQVLAVSSSIVFQVLVNFGTVICTANNSLNNIFIPKNKISGLELKTIGSEDYIKSNVVNVGFSKGCLCLRIVFEEQSFLSDTYQKEWTMGLFNKSTEDFKKYLDKYQKDIYLKQNISSDMDNINFADPNLGLSISVYVPIWESLDPVKTEDYEALVKLLKEELGKEKKLQGENWKEETSDYYVPVNPDDPYGNLKDAGAFTAQPKDYVFNTALLPLVNISPKIKDVFLEFIQSNLATLKEEERLDKYNFIVESTDSESGEKIYSKLIPIAWIDIQSDTILEQIVDFDYIFNFPYYYCKLENAATNKVSNFKFAQQEDQGQIF